MLSSFTKQPNPLLDPAGFPKKPQPAAETAYASQIITSLLNGEVGIGDVLARNKVNPYDVISHEPDYDFSRYYQDNRSNDPSSRGEGEGGTHFTDHYKLPNHPTYSSESSADLTMAAIYKNVQGRWWQGVMERSAYYTPAGLMTGKEPKYEQW